MIWYVGKKPTGRYEAFSSASSPSERSHGRFYVDARGPFRTRTEAEGTAREWNGAPETQRDKTMKKKKRSRKSRAKFERCVQKVKKSRSRVNPWAVCNASIRSKRSRRDPKKGYRKIWFAKGRERTAGLVVSDAWIQKHGHNLISEASRLFPLSEMRKMGRMHMSPSFSTWEEAFQFQTHNERKPFPSSRDRRFVNRAPRRDTSRKVYGYCDACGNPIHEEDQILCAKCRAKNRAKKSSARDYNGWPNWETWNVHLWFSNTEDLYRMVREERAYQKFTAKSVEKFVRAVAPRGTPDMKRRGEEANYKKVRWGRIAKAFNQFS